MGDKETWYTNKELFEMLQDFKTELQETRLLIKEYNGIRAKLNEVTYDIAVMKSKALGRASVSEGIRLWGGWIFGFISLLIAYIKMYS